MKSDKTGIALFLPEIISFLWADQFGSFSEKQATLSPFLLDLVRWFRVVCLGTAKKRRRRHGSGRRPQRVMWWARRLKGVDARE
jgi:hypothetical protein